MAASLINAGHARDAAVAVLMERVGFELIMPRFRNLQPCEIEKKSKGELVTSVDRDVEAALTRGLNLIDPFARVIGEEAVEADPSLVTHIGRGAVWIVDPIDGTANFIAGNAPFGIMIAYAIDGVVEASWIHDPMTGRMCFARRGGGAWMNGERFSAPRYERLRPVAALATQFMTADARAAVEARAAMSFDLVPIPRCAAEHYPRVAMGINDVAMFQRTLPWDHAPGVLFLEEAGCSAIRWNGDPYRIDDDGLGLVIATTAYALDLAVGTLFSGPSAARGLRRGLAA